MAKGSRPEHKIMADLQAALSEYRSKVNDAPPAEGRALSDAVKALQDELQAHLTAGAVDDPEGNRPIGIHQPTYYEIGSPWCQDDEGYPLRSKGATRDEAVDNWNNGIYWQKAPTPLRPYRPQDQG